LRTKIEIYRKGKRVQKEITIIQILQMVSIKAHFRDHDVNEQGHIQQMKLGVLDVNSLIYFSNIK
jgi:hypothetical protein